MEGREVDKEEEDEGGVEEGGRVTAVTGTENVARVTSGLCWTGEVAVWACVCFSRFLHLALRFWNHTWRGGGGGRVGWVG